LIDDRGNLMATRFSGNRGYTIHLPESIDPLDVMDLSDPSDPKLTDVLEIPGWVEHLEVSGYDILAVGVDNEMGRNVAMYMFDVTDSDNAVLRDRVVIGTGSTYSDANFDPKALTILWDQGLVLLPFSSYDWTGPYGGSSYGVQLISFDLGAGKLVLNGAFITDEPVTRTRIVSGNIAGIGTTMLWSVAADDPNGPEIEAVLELAYYVQDAFPAEGKIVSLVPSVNWWGSTKSERCKVLVTSEDDPYSPLKVITVEGLTFMGMQRVGTKVLVKGISQAGDGSPVWELHRFDLAKPLTPVELTIVSVPIDMADPYAPYPVYDEEYYYGNETVKEREGGEPGTPDDDDDGDMVPPSDGDGTDANDSFMPYLYNDPMQWYVLEDGSVLVTMTNYGNYYSSYYYYDAYYKDPDSPRPQDWSLIPWTGSEVSSFNISALPYVYADRTIGSSEHFLMSFNDYSASGSRIVEVSFDGSSVSVDRTFTVNGRTVGARSDLKRLYTLSDWYDDKGYHTTIGVYDIEDGPEFLKGLDVEPGMSVVHMDDDLIVCAPTYWYYYRGGIYMEGEYDDVAVSAEKALPDYYQGADEQVYTLASISLDDEGVFSGMTAHRLKGYWNVAFAQDRTLVLSSGQTASGLRFDPDGSAEQLGPWTVYGSPTGGGVDDDTIALAFGYSGTIVVAA
jgi:hypothetical protein